MRLVDPFTQEPLNNARSILPKKTTHWAEKDLRIVVGGVAPAAVLTALALLNGLSGESALFFAGGPLIALYLIARVEAAVVPPLCDKERVEILERWSNRGPLRWAFRYLLVSTFALHWGLALLGSAAIARASAVAVVPGLSLMTAVPAFVLGLTLLAAALFCVWLHFDHRTFSQWLADIPDHIFRLLGLEAYWLRSQFNSGLRFQ